MTIRSLTQALVDRAMPLKKSSKKSYIIRDQKLKGFHLRVSPKGRRQFALEVTKNGVRKYFPIGDADLISVHDARDLAMRKIDALMLATNTAPIKQTQHISFDALAELTFQRQARLWKPSTLRVNHQ